MHFVTLQCVLFWWQRLFVYCRFIKFRSQFLCCYLWKSRITKVHVMLCQNCSPIHILPEARKKKRFSFHKHRGSQIGVSCVRQQSNQVYTHSNTQYRSSAFAIIYWDLCICITSLYLLNLTISLNILGKRRTVKCGITKCQLNIHKVWKNYSSLSWNFNFSLSSTA